jgi:hypothetical protein
MVTIEGDQDELHSLITPLSIEYMTMYLLEGERERVKQIYAYALNDPAGRLRVELVEFLPTQWKRRFDIRE